MILKGSYIFLVSIYGNNSVWKQQPLDIFLISPPIQSAVIKREVGKSKPILQGESQITANHTTLKQELSEEKGSYMLRENQSRASGSPHVPKKTPRQCLSVSVSSIMWISTHILSSSKLRHEIIHTFLWANYLLQRAT